MDESLQIILKEIHEDVREVRDEVRVLGSEIARLREERHKDQLAHTALDQEVKDIKQGEKKRNAMFAGMVAAVVGLVNAMSSKIGLTP